MLTSQLWTLRRGSSGVKCTTPRIGDLSSESGYCLMVPSLLSVLGAEQPTTLGLGAPLRSSELKLQNVGSSFGG